jgi:hypothetical protein
MAAYDWFVWVIDVEIAATHTCSLDSLQLSEPQFQTPNHSEKHPTLHLPQFAIADFNYILVTNGNHNQHGFGFR